MIVRIKNKSKDRFTDCCNVSIIPDITEVGKDSETYCIIYTFENGRDITFSLSNGDEIYFMNKTGKTIHKDFRMLVTRN